MNKWMTALAFGAKWRRLRGQWIRRLGCGERSGRRTKRAGEQRRQRDFADPHGAILKEMPPRDVVGEIGGRGRV